MVGDEKIETPAPLIDGAEVVVPEEHGQLALVQGRLYSYMCKHNLSSVEYFVYYDRHINDLVKNTISSSTAKNSSCIANNSEKARY